MPAKPNDRGNGHHQPWRRPVVKPRRRLVDYAPKSAGVAAPSPVDLLRRNNLLPCRGVLHIGAGECEEIEEYYRAGIHSVYWVEARRMSKTARDKAIHYGHRYLDRTAITDLNQPSVGLYTTSNSGLSSSIMVMKDHLLAEPSVSQSGYEFVDNLTGHQLLERAFGKDHHYPDVLVLDVQGAELRAIKSFMEEIRWFKAIVCEVELIEAYEGQPMFHDVWKYMTSTGWKLSDLSIHRSTFLWGDAVWTRK